MRQFQGVRFAVLPVLRMKLPHSMILLLALIHDCNSSTQFTIYYITCVEIIVVPPNTGDGPRASESTGVSDALGSSRERNSNFNRAIMGFIYSYMQIRWLIIFILWVKMLLQWLRDATISVIEEMNPTIGVAFLALSIQNIYQVAFSQAATSLKDKSIQHVNALAVFLLLYGVLAPSRRAGGRIAMMIGVILVSGTAAALALR